MLLLLNKVRVLNYNSKKIMFFFLNEYTVDFKIWYIVNLLIIHNFVNGQWNKLILIKKSVITCYTLKETINNKAEKR